MLKPFSMIFFILVMVWTGAIFLTSSPATRIERACVPATVADKIVVAIVQLAYEPWALDAHQMMLNVEYGCKYTVWKTFYEDVLDRSGTEVPAVKAQPTQKVPTAAPQSAPQKEQQSQPVPKQTEAVEEPHTPEKAKPLPNYMETK